MFKERPAKKRISTTETTEDATLDAKHQTMINRMTAKYDEIDQLKETLNEYKNQITKLNRQIEDISLHSISETDHTTDNKSKSELSERWDKLILLTDKMTDLERQVERLERKDDEIEYFNDAGKILFQYYDMVNNHEPSVATKQVKKQYQVHRCKTTKTIATRSVLDILNMCINNKDKKDIIDNKDETDDTTNDTKVNTNTVEDHDNIDNKMNKCDLIDMYLAKIDQSYLPASQNHLEAHMDKCVTCGGLLICVQQDGILFCQTCGYQEQMLIEQNRPIYRQVVNREASHYSYKRINHFNEWLSQIQGKESTDIPEEIFDKIVQEIKKEKINDTSKLTHAKMREILKRLKGNKYYEHLAYIMQRINNKPSPNFPPELEEKLRSMFKEIQAPFLKHCPPTRKNFLSYSYVIYKCLQLLGKDEYLRYFPLLKSREKLHLQDAIWRNICGELNWTVYASL